MLWTPHTWPITTHVHHQTTTSQTSHWTHSNLPNSSICSMFHYVERGASSAKTHWRNANSQGHDTCWPSRRNGGHDVSRRHHQITVHGWHKNNHFQQHGIQLVSVVIADDLIAHYNTVEQKGLKAVHELSQRMRHLARPQEGITSVIPMPLIDFVKLEKFDAVLSELLRHFSHF